MHVTPTHTDCCSNSALWTSIVLGLRAWVLARPGVDSISGSPGLKHDRTFLRMRLGVHKPKRGICEPSTPCEEAMALRNHSRCVHRGTSALGSSMEEPQQLLGSCPPPQSLDSLLVSSPFTCNPGIPGGPGGPGTPGGPCRREDKIRGVEESSLPPWTAVVSWREKPRQEARQRTQATHTCGPGCEELPIHSPGAPWVGVGVAKEGERL